MLMAAHCTDWKAPVRPSGLPFSTIIASVRTSVKAMPRPMISRKTARLPYIGSPSRPSATPASVASAEVRRK